MRHPALPRALILGGTFFRFNPSYSVWLPDVFGEDPAGVDTARFLRNHPEWAAWLQQIYGPDAWSSILDRVRPMWTTPFEYGPEALARITAPALVLLGDRDEVLPIEEAAALYRRLPAGELAVVPGADHGDFFFAKVDLFQALMLDFLRRQDVPARNRAP
jgi:pimeloyl-ACP methyl ester carboxylesterase